MCGSCGDRVRFRLADSLIYETGVFQIFPLSFGRQLDFRLLRQISREEMGMHFCPLSMQKGMGLGLGHVFFAI